MGEETPRLRFNTHQDILDFADRGIKQSKDHLAKQRPDFPKRYIDAEMDIVVRSKFKGTDSVCDFIFSAIPNGPTDEKHSGGGLRAPTDNNVKKTNDAAYRIVIVGVSDCVDGIERQVRSSVTMEMAYYRNDIRAEIFERPFNRIFRLKDTVPEREVPGMSGSIRQPCSGKHTVIEGANGGGSIIHHSIGDLAEDQRELFYSSLEVHINSLGPWVLIKDTLPLQPETVDILLCNRINDGG